MKTENEKTPLKPQGVNDKDENEKISKIRDILFGSNISEYEQRFNTLEARLHKDLNNLSEELNSKGDKIEKQFNDNITKLSKQLNDEVDERKSGDKHSSNEIQSINDKIDKQYNEIQESIHDIKKSVSELEINLREVIRKNISDLRSQFEEETDRLNNIKTDKSSLAVLLSELAYQLSGGSKEESEEKQ